MPGEVPLWWRDDLLSRLGRLGTGSAAAAAGALIDPQAPEHAASYAIIAASILSSLQRPTQRSQIVADFRAGRWPSFGSVVGDLTPAFMAQYNNVINAPASGQVPYFIAIPQRGSGSGQYLPAGGTRRPTTQQRFGSAAVGRADPNEGRIVIQMFPPPAPPPFQVPALAPAGPIATVSPLRTIKQIIIRALVRNGAAGVQGHPFGDSASYPPGFFTPAERAVLINLGAIREANRAQILPQMAAGHPMLGPTDEVMWAVTHGGGTAAQRAQVAAWRAYVEALRAERAANAEAFLEMDALARYTDQLLHWGNNPNSLNSALQPYISSSPDRPSINPPTPNPGPELSSGSDDWYSMLEGYYAAAASAQGGSGGGGGGGVPN